MAFSESNAISKLLRGTFCERVVEIAENISANEVPKLNKYILGYARSKEILEKNRSHFYILNERIEEGLVNRGPEENLQDEPISDPNNLITNGFRMLGGNSNGSGQEVMVEDESQPNHLPSEDNDHSSESRKRSLVDDEEAIDMFNISTSSNDEGDEENVAAPQLNQAQQAEALELANELLEFDSLQQPAVEEEEDDEDIEDEFVNDARLRVFMGTEEDDEDTGDMVLITEEEMRKRGMLDEEEEGEEGDEAFVDPLEGLSFEELKKRLPPYYFMNNKKKRKYFRKLSVNYLTKIQSRKIEKKARVNFQLDKNQVRQFKKNEQVN